MLPAIEVKVPDIGDFKDLPIIDILVKPGDTVGPEDPLVSLESDKATMDVPSPVAGVVKEIAVKVGDKVSEGSLILLLEAPEAATPAKASTASAAVSAAPAAPVASAAPAARGPAAAPPVAAAISSASSPAPAFGGKADLDCDVLVLGGGPGGYSAAFRAADLGQRVVLVERYPTLGGVCLNVGCIPSKALLHVAAVMDEVKHFGDIGITFEAPKIDIDRLRAHKSKVVGKLTGGLSMMAKARQVNVVRGLGTFLDANHVEVVETTGSDDPPTAARKVVRFASAIIAVGSQPVKLPFLPDDPRIVDSTGALELRSIPAKMLVIGGGIIGLEMGTVYSALGTRLDVVEMMDSLMLGADRDLVRVWQKMNEKRFDRVMLGTKTVGVEARPDGLYATFEGAAAPAGPQRYDMILSSVGRAPNGRKIAAERAGVSVDARGFIAVDRQMRTSAPNIFAIGDVVGQPMLAHKAVHEGHVAAEAAAGEKSFFDARVIPAVAYTDPEVAWVGLTEDDAKKQGIAVEKGLFPWAASGRAIANGRDEGFTKLLFDASTHRIVGGGIVGTHAGDLIGEVALAIEMGCDSVDIGKTIHPHPTLGESIGLAAEAAEGTCTDLPPPRRR
jgi:dihydrolipoamide dehydrogenase